MRRKSYLLLILSFIMFVPSISCKDDDPDPYLRIEETAKTQIFESKASQLDVTVESNIDFTAKSADTWCSVIVEDQKLMIKVDENKDTNGRETKITLTGNKVPTLEITVKQGGTAPYIILNPEFVTIDFATLQFDLEVVTNIDIEFNIEAPWIKLKAESKTNTYSFTVEATNTQRSGKIKVKGKDSEITVECVVKQAEDMDIAPKFAVISDTHFTATGTDAPTKVKRTLELLLKQNPDAIFVVGDITDNGRENQYKKALETFQIVPSTIPVYYMMGNHDRYEDASGSFFVNNLKQDLNQYIEIKGHPFITISQDARHNTGSGIYKDGVKKFLSEKLEHAAANFPNKPIFVFYHTPLENTCYGSNGWGTNDLAEILNKYPQIVAFSGHSHFPLGDERSIHQNIFTSVNDGSQTYSEIEPTSGFSDGIHPANYKLVTEAVVVVPKDNQELKEQGKYYKNFMLERWDTYRNIEIKEPWVIKAPHNGSQFTYKSRSGSVPAFDKTTKPVISNITTNGCTVEWAQAKPINTYDKVHHYEVAVMNGSAPVSTYKVFSQFYLNTDMPGKLSWNIAGLNTGTKYKIEIKAIDSWYTNKSTPIISDEFTTTIYVADPSVKAPIADAFDVAFTPRGGVDYSVMGHTLTTGTSTPAISYNASLKMYTSTYTSDVNSYHGLSYKGNEAFKDKIAKSFSLEIFYKTTDTREVAPVGAMEAGGLGIEQTAGGGITRLWVDLGKGYLKLGTTKTDNVSYYHMVFTYNGSKLTAYTNGIPTEELNATGQIKFPTNENGHWFAFGGDAGTGTVCQGSLNGDVVFSRMYSEGLSRNEVVRLYEQIGYRANMNRIGDLHTAILQILPDKGNPPALVNEAWALMNKLNTTDSDITAFLEKVNGL